MREIMFRGKVDDGEGVYGNFCMGTNARTVFKVTFGKRGE